MVIICLDKKIGSLRNEDDDGYEDFNDLKIRVRVIHITTKLFHVVSRRKCAVTVDELNWYEWVGSVERELKIPRHVLTSSTEP